MSMKIVSLDSYEILDSRGNPTVETKVVLENGISAYACVPSGASTGTHEALELRDTQSSRYHGKGVLQATQNVTTVLSPVVVGKDVFDIENIDKAMIECDGTENKEKLGANALLSVSLACVRAGALSRKIPLHEYIGDFFGNDSSYVMPIPMMNILNGGKHAVGSTDMQEYMIMPIGAPSFSEALRYGSEVFHTLGDILKDMNLPTTVGDEGGYAPRLATNEEPLALIVEAIEKAGYKVGSDISIALDIAANEICDVNVYHLKSEKRSCSADQMIELYKDWCAKYPIVSIEDGLYEDDWDGFSKMTKAIGDTVQVVGDDLYVTNEKRLTKGIELHATNSILVKLNQIGTFSETVSVVNMAKSAGMSAVVSHRSGETEDTFIADFVVGSGSGQIKSGSASRSERIAKYNQLLRIERALGEKSSYATFPFSGSFTS